MMIFISIAPYTALVNMSSWLGVLVTVGKVGLIINYQYLLVHSSSMGSGVSATTKKGDPDHDDVKEITDGKEDTEENANAVIFDTQSSYVESWRTKWLEAYRIIVAK